MSAYRPRFRPPPWIALAVPCLAAASALAAPAPATHPALYNAISAMPAGSWKQVSTNSYQSVWTPASQRPLYNSNGRNPTPFKIISAWSGYGWDTRRGDLIIYGGGHANYPGNDLYRWRGSTLKWERMSLPSEIVAIPAITNGYETIDGPLNAAGSAHTYDSNLYLPNVDRFVTFGGALFNTGATYVIRQANGTYRKTGPYFVNPARADANKVGGLTGSHVKRVFPYPEVVGARMWENRDIHKHLAGSPLPRTHINGCTAYAEEGGRDVVYISGGAERSLFRYTVGTLDNPGSDKIVKVGAQVAGATGQMTCALDQKAGLFVKSGPMTKPFTYWNLATASPTNGDKAVVINASINGFLNWLAANSLKITHCALDHDPVRSRFLVWCGGGSVWTLTPPADKSPNGWTMARLQPANAQAPTAATGTGILGKWRYIPGYDVFIALQDPTQGYVWVYKPQGWKGGAQLLADASAFSGARLWPSVAQASDGESGMYAAQNLWPSVELGSEVETSLVAGETTRFTAEATDQDGAIERVEFYLDDQRIGEAVSAPYSVQWRAARPGAYTLTAKAFDNAGAETTSSSRHVVVRRERNQQPTVALVSPAGDAAYASGTVVHLMADARDADGRVMRVEFLANGEQIGRATSSPWALAWTPPEDGAYEITAIAIDNRDLTSEAAVVNVQIGNVPPPPH